jgi:HEAT repeat protein
MEVLGPIVLRVALDVAFVLAAMSAIVLAVIIGVRLSAQNENRRRAHFRRDAEPLVTSYLAGRTETREVVTVLHRDPAHGLDLLMEISDRLAPAERAPLAPLFASLPLRAKETAALQSRRWERRMQAAEHLGYLGDKGSVSALVEALRDPIIAVRLSAAHALAALGATQHIRDIVLTFDLPGEMNQRRVAEALRDFGPAGTPQLLEILADRRGAYSDNAVGMVVRVLGMLRAPEAVEPLVPLLEHPEFRVRLNTVRSLGLIGDHGTADKVARLANDPAWEVRNVVIQSLGRMRSERHATILADALRDSSWWVRFSAAQALWSLGDKGRRALTEAMTGSPDRYARDMSRQILEENGALPPREAHA